MVQMALSCLSCPDPNRLVFIYSFDLVFVREESLGLPFTHALETFPSSLEIECNKSQYPGFISIDLCSLSAGLQSAYPLSEAVMNPSLKWTLAACMLLLT